MLYASDATLSLPYSVRMRSHKASTLSSCPSLTPTRQSSTSACLARGVAECCSIKDKNLDSASAS